MPFLDNGGTRIHWEEQGEGTPVLLVMGHRFSSRMWWPVLPELAKHHRVLTFDNRGTGQSGTASVLTVDDMVGDALAVLDAAGVDAAHVYGVSMGGGIALELGMAHRERVRSLVLGCIGAKTEVIGTQPLLKRALYHLPSRLLVPLSRKALYGDACPPERMAKDMEMLRTDTTDKGGVIAQAKAVAAYTTTLEQVAGITSPTLVLHGTADPVVPYAGGVQLSETIPGARLVSYEGARHNFVVDHGDEANAEVLAFFADVDARVAA